MIRRRRPLIAGNWKMNLTVRGSVELAREVVAAARGLADRDVAVFPGALALHAVAAILADSAVLPGSQNHWYAPDGAFTGEVSAAQARDAGARIALVGHSERRHILGESDETVARKVAAGLEAGLGPVLCVGETLAERESSRTEAVIERQVRTGLAGLSAPALARMTLAYEPVWAIGTGRTATPDQAGEVHRFIRGLVGTLHGRAVAEDMRILYGGSVKPDNVDGLLALPDIDGALVGGASLDATQFQRILRFRCPAS